MKSRDFLLASALLIVSAPALAAWDRLGSFHVDYRHDRDAQNLDLGGPVDRLQLSAENSDIDCRGVRAEFANGNSRTVFKGSIRSGEDQVIDLPGQSRNIQRLVFNCGAREHRGGIIRISADIGRHREEWRRHPDFQRKWSQLLGWGAGLLNGGNGSDQWQLIATERFEGRRDRESSVTGWRGRKVDTIALKPIDADARCRRVTAHFGNGKSRNLDLGRDQHIHRGELKSVDLPGGDRDLQSVSLACQATNDHSVSIQVFVRR
jgi:hypothetical protein